MPDTTVKSVARVFAVLELFAQRRTGLSATEIERALDYPKSSTIALVKSMVALGYLSYDRLSRRYLPTVRVNQLGHWMNAVDGFRDLDALIDDCTAATGETVVVASQNDLQMQLLMVRAGSSPLRVNYTAGTMLPLFGSNVGMVCLATKTDADIRRLAERTNRRAGASGLRVTDLDGVIAAAAQIRQAGHGIGYGNYAPFLGSIGWPLLGRGEGASLVLSVGGQIDSIRTAEATIVNAIPSILRSHGFYVTPRMLGSKEHAAWPKT